jgi:hypothetical protein
VAEGLSSGRRLGSWAAVFLVTSILTSVTGFGFPVNVLLPLFRRLTDLSELAPTQSEPPFAIAQLLVLATFVWLGVAADAGMRTR